MSLPPLLMRCQMSDGGRHFPLWIPLFLLCPLVLAILLIVAPFFLVVAAVLRGGAWCRRLLRLGWALMRCLCSLRGLNLDVRRGRERFVLSVK